MPPFVELHDRPRIAYWRCPPIRCDAFEVAFALATLSATLQIVESIRQRRKSFHGVPIARRQVEQRRVKPLRFSRSPTVAPDGHGKQNSGCKSSARRRVEAVENGTSLNIMEIGGSGASTVLLLICCYFGSPGRCVPVTLAHIRAEASSSRPMPDAASSETSAARQPQPTGNFAERAMSDDAEVFTKISTLRGA
jgi:hypothetical protein